MLRSRGKELTCKISSHILRWLFGGCLYGLLEIAWRGYTHWTMILLAALLCIPLDIANEHIPWDMPLPLQGVLGGLTITAMEFVTGLIVNVWFGLGVWDYSDQIGNILGQICPLYTILWCLLAIPVIAVFDWLEYKICGGEKPYYTV